MQVHFHLGVHGTGGDRLLRALRRAAPALAASGVAVPDHEGYRALLREAAVSGTRERAVPLDPLLEWGTAAADPGASPSPRAPRAAPARGLFAAREGGAAVADRRGRTDPVLTRQSRPDRLVLFNDDFLGPPLTVLRDRAFYADAAGRATRLAAAFPMAVPSFSLALCRPTAFLDHLIAEYGDGPGLADLRLLRGAGLTWAPVVQALRRVQPDAPILVWREEDMALICHDALLAVAEPGVHAALPEPGVLLADWLPGEALPRLVHYLASHPPANRAQYGRVIKSFLRLYVQAAGAEAGAPDPGYAADLQAIRAVPGVRVLRR